MARTLLAALIKADDTVAGTCTTTVTTTDDWHQHMDAERIRAELTAQELWLRYLALGGTNDAFDLDGYLQGLLPLDPASSMKPADAPARAGQKPKPEPQRPV